MKPLLLILALALWTPLTLNAQPENKFDLDPSQSMLMTGKGPGQDGAINPYYGQDCVAIVKNLGKHPFSIRIQQQGKIIETIPVAKKEVKKVQLLKGYELYLDTSKEGKVKAKIDFVKPEE